MQNEEFLIQRALIQYIELQYPKVLFCASAGGMYTTKTSAIRMKQAGYRRGFPDLFIYHPNRTHMGLAIELKKEQGGRVSKEQLQWIQDLRARRYQAYICHGLDSAISVLDEYMAS